MPNGFLTRNPTSQDISELAELMLDAYKGTVDYDGEGMPESVKEVKSYFERADSVAMLEQSFVAVAGNRLAAACLMSKWEKREEPLIAYIMTRASFKGRGLASALTSLMLESLRDSGRPGVTAFVTDGNTPSEKLLSRLGFKRLG